MPNWTANKIRFSGKREDIVSVLKLVIVGKEFIESVKKDEFDLCKHVQSHPNYCDSDRKVCEKCEHGKLGFWFQTHYIHNKTNCNGQFCPLLSPNGEDISEWQMVKVNDYGLHPSNLKEGEVYFGILIPQPKGMFQGGTNDAIAKRNARFGIEDWFDWNKTNWGTKWNPNRGETTFEWLDDTTAELSFCTAWSLPEPWLRKLAEECKKHNVEIEGEFADEDFGSDMGEFRTTTADDDCDDDILVTHDSMNEELYERCWGEGSLDDCDGNED